MNLNCGMVLASKGLKFCKSMKKTLTDYKSRYLERREAKKAVAKKRSAYKLEQGRERLRNNRTYAWMTKASKVLDRYYLDAIVGLVPGGVGDIVTALFSMVHVYFGAYVIKSPALSIALLNNIVRDVVIGLIPFYVGDVLDAFHRSNRQNMALINGYVDGDEEVMREVERKKNQGIATLIVLLIVLVALIVLLVKFGLWLGSLVTSCAS